MAFLFDGDTNERHYLYEDDQTDYGGQKQLFDTDYVVVIPRKHVQDAHGGQYVQTGDPVKVICCVEGRAQQAGMFSISGAEDKTPSSDNPGGLDELLKEVVRAGVNFTNAYGRVLNDGSSALFMIDIQDIPDAHRKLAELGLNIISDERVYGA